MNLCLHKFLYDINTSNKAFMVSLGDILPPSLGFLDNFSGVSFRSFLLIDGPGVLVLVAVFLLFSEG